jgi:3-hydroxy-9,10-secoandrosta-1,3,5(10)-triene-9,17-dione monooxygenase
MNAPDIQPGPKLGSYPLIDIQRLFRDAHAAAGHFAFSVDAQLPPWGLDALGGEVHSPTL